LCGTQLADNIFSGVCVLARAHWKRPAMDLLDRLGACETTLISVLELASRSLTGLAAAASPAEIEASNAEIVAALARVHRDVGAAVLAIADAKKAQAAAHTAAAEAAAAAAVAAAAATADTATAAAGAQ